MADPTATQPTHEASMPETSAPTQFYTAQQQHHHHHQSAQPPHSQPEPLDLLKAEPFRPSQFRPSKPFSVGKLTLASCNSVFAIAALGLSIGILTIALYDMIGVLIAGTMALISLLWQIAEYLTLTIRRSIHRPIHPGAHVGVHLFLWVLALFVTVSCCFTLADALAGYTVDPQCSSSGSGYFTTPTTNSSDANDNYVYCDYYSFPSIALAQGYISLFEALAAFSVLLLIGHFALFVLACIETHRRRKWGRKRGGKGVRVVYVAAKTTPGAPDGATSTAYYYRQVPTPMSMPVQQQAEGRARLSEES